MAGESKPYVLIPDEIVEAAFVLNTFFDRRADEDARLLGLQQELDDSVESHTRIRLAREGVWNARHAFNFVEREVDMVLGQNQLAPRTTPEPEQAVVSSQLARRKRVGRFLQTFGFSEAIVRRR